MDNLSMLQNLVTPKEACVWASRFLEKEVSLSNITYLIQYGKIKRHGNNGSILVNIAELEKYYNSFHGRREFSWKEKLGEDLNWALSFDHLREKDTTKHVHRLHPYKGKFIPQLVEYFLDDHTDQFKKRAFFKKGDIILDPFCGSGTTLVQSNELDMHSIGIDVSRFNCLVSEVKLLNYDFESLQRDINSTVESLNNFESDNNIGRFESDLYEKLFDFNNEHFPSPEFRRRVVMGKVNEDSYAYEKEKMFLARYNELVKKHGVKLGQSKNGNFLDKWYIENARNEIDRAFELVRGIKDKNNKKLLAVILSRTIRSCRATTHSDLATLKRPQLTTYYCYKHKKICKPIFSIKEMFAKYAFDTFERVKVFSHLKTKCFTSIISADSRKVNLFEEIKRSNPSFHKLLENKKINGIFTSPPYVGQIDYHEQHAYAYDLMGFLRKDELEIGPLFKGQGLEARKSYIEGISNVLLNCRRFLADNYNAFIVANDKFDLYPEIATRAGMAIVNRFRRPVLNRTERDKAPYSEIIFHLKEKAE